MSLDCCAFIKIANQSTIFIPIDCSPWSKVQCLIGCLVQHRFEVLFLKQILQPTVPQVCCCWLPLWPPRSGLPWLKLFRAVEKTMPPARWLHLSKAWSTGGWEQLGVTWPGDGWKMRILMRLSAIHPGPNQVNFGSMVRFGKIIGKCGQS